MQKYSVIIIGSGLAGLECGRTFLQHNQSDFIILEKNPTIIKSISWKTFPSVVKKFGLENCILNTIDHIYFRASDITNLRVLSNLSRPIDCTVLESKTVFQFYQTILHDKIHLSEEVINIQRSNGSEYRYKIDTATTSYTSDYIIDASGSQSIVDRYLFPNAFFKQTIFMPCYCKRYTHCDTIILKHDAIMDFDDPLLRSGCWCYPIDKIRSEIGVARYAYSDNIQSIIPELNCILETLYKKLPPFDIVFTEHSKYIETLSGVIPLLPRPYCTNDDEHILYIGDTKGAVPYSGYGVENALESGRKSAISILSHKKYKYYITPPAQGLVILLLLLKLTPVQLHILSTGISELSPKEVKKFFTGHTDLSFLLHANTISKKRGLSLLGSIPKRMLFKILFNKLPNTKDYTLMLSLK